MAEASPCTGTVTNWTGKFINKVCFARVFLLTRLHHSRGVPYVVRELKVADYIFFIGDKLTPILIERKTAEDVASSRKCPRSCVSLLHSALTPILALTCIIETYSVHDGRWERQQRNMRKAQFVLGGGPDRRCQICCKCLDYACQCVSRKNRSNK